MTNGKYNPSLRTDVSHLLSLISDFEFVAILVITKNIFDLTLMVTQLLQGKKFKKKLEVLVCTSRIALPLIYVPIWNAKPVKSVLSCIFLLLS
jgi:hypothetical protein